MTKFLRLLGFIGVAVLISGLLVYSRGNPISLNIYDVLFGLLVGYSGYHHYEIELLKRRLKKIEHSLKPAESEEAVLAILASREPTKK